MVRKEMRARADDGSLPPLARARALAVSHLEVRGKGHEECNELRNAFVLRDRAVERLSHGHATHVAGIEWLDVTLGLVGQQDGRPRLFVDPARKLNVHRCHPIPCIDQEKNQVCLPDHLLGTLQRFC